VACSRHAGAGSWAPEAVSVLIVRARTVSVEIVSVLMISVRRGRGGVRRRPPGQGPRKATKCMETPPKIFFSCPTPFPQHM
jgi:hypothetical protein